MNKTVPDKETDSTSIAVQSYRPMVQPLQTDLTVCLFVSLQWLRLQGEQVKCDPG